MGGGNSVLLHWRLRLFFSALFGLGLFSLMLGLGGRVVCVAIYVGGVGRGMQIGGYYVVSLLWLGLLLDGLPLGDLVVDNQVYHNLNVIGVLCQQRG